MTQQSRLAPYLALAAVSFFWGTTYLGIRMALEAFSPLLLLATRFLISGSVMMLGAYFFRIEIPRGRELWLTALYGLIMLGISTGCLVFAEQWVPSGLASLFVTVAPFWMVGLEAFVPGGARLRLPVVSGLLVGFCGVLLLLAPGARQGGWNPNLMKGFLLQQVGCLCWSLGSILQKRLPVRTNPIVGGGVQQLATGLAYLPLALLLPGNELTWEPRGIWAMFYLATFGSLVGYSAYVYALHHLPVAVVSLYMYINPIVAVSLGWLFYREPFGWHEAVAMLIIFTGVALVKQFGVPSASKQAKAEAA